MLKEIICTIIEVPIAEPANMYIAPGIEIKPSETKDITIIEKSVDDCIINVNIIPERKPLIFDPERFQSNSFNLYPEILEITFEENFKPSMKSNQPEEKFQESFKY